MRVGDWMMGLVCALLWSEHHQAGLSLSFLFFPYTTHSSLPFAVLLVYSCATTGERKTPDCDGCASLARRHWHWKEPGRKINDERAGYADSFFISLPVSFPSTTTTHTTQLFFFSKKSFSLIQDGFEFYLFFPFLLHTDFPFLKDVRVKKPTTPFLFFNFLWK